MLIIILGIITFFIAAYWTIFTKAGKPGYAAIIPIYNFIVLLEIVGKPWWWILLIFVPIVNIVVIIMMYHSLALSFGKGVGYTLGFIFLGFIFIPMLAFGKAQYIGPGGSAN